MLILLLLSQLTQRVAQANDSLVMRDRALRPNKTAKASVSNHTGFLPCEAFCNNASRSRGFTTIELIIIITILAILAVFAAPRFFSSGVAEQTYQQRLITSLRYMQQRAMHDTRDLGFCYQVNVFGGANSRFGPGSLNYTDTSVPNILQSCIPGVDGSQRADPFTTGSGEMASDNVSITSGNMAIRFNSMGCTLTSGVACSQRYTVDIQGPDRVRKVCVEPQGYIHACD